MLYLIVLIVADIQPKPVIFSPQCCIKEGKLETNGLELGPEGCLSHLRAFTIF